MSIDIQKWKAEAHENAAKTVANMLQVGNKVNFFKSCSDLYITHSLHVLDKAGHLTDTIGKTYM